jgi:hypothetical protein
MDGGEAAYTHEAADVDDSVGPPFRPLETVAAFVLGVIGLNVIGVAPVLLGALQDEHRLSAAGIGLTAMLELLSMGVATGLCGAFLPPRRMRLIGLLMSLLLAGLNLAGLHASGLGVLLVRTAAGAPEGVLLWITVGLIARTLTPERWAAVFFTAQVAAQLALAGVLWIGVLSRFGANGGLWTLALSSLIGVPVAFFAPNRYGLLTPDEGQAGAPPARGWFALLAAAVFVSANGAVSLYLEPLARQAGLPAGVARTALFASLMGQLLGGVIATVLAGKVKYMTVFSLCTALYLIVWAIYGLAAPAWLFIAVSALSGLTALLVGPFLTPLTIEADPTRRTAMQAGGAQILGGAGGPLLSSFLVSDANVRSVLAQGAIALGLGLAMIAAIRFAVRHDKVAG